MPRHRFMSAYEQRIEPPDRRWQYLLMAAEPYETIAFKVGRWSLSLSLSRAVLGVPLPAGPCFWAGRGRHEVVPHGSGAPTTTSPRPCEVLSE